MSFACSGPFIVAVDGWTVEAEGVTFFTVQISGAGRGHTVSRRYREFLRLDQEVRRGLRHLPDLPPRSEFRKRLQSGFMETRRQGLGTFLAAVVATDPFCLRTPALRKFLDLPERAIQGNKILLGRECLIPSAATGLCSYGISDDSDVFEQ